MLVNFNRITESIRLEIIKTILSLKLELVFLNKRIFEKIEPSILDNVEFMGNEFKNFSYENLCTIKKKDGNIDKWLLNSNNIYKCEDEIFLKTIILVFDPTVEIDQNLKYDLKNKINVILRASGWIIEVSKYVETLFFTFKDISRVPYNQGNVRSDNIAVIKHDGLNFRSRHEILIYEELRKRKIIFSALPVFFDNSGNRIEPDFVIIHDGIFSILEVDNDSTHPETPYIAQKRVENYLLQGIRVWRINSHNSSDASWAKTEVSEVLNKIKRSKVNQ